MINPPTENVILPEDERIIVLENRLLDFQHQVRKEKAVLSDASASCARAIKEREYQVGLLNETLAKLVEAKTELASVSEALLTSKQGVEKHQKDAKSIRDSHETRFQELNAKERELNEKEEMFKKNVASFSLDKIQLDKDKEGIREIKQTLINVVEKINQN